MRPNSDKANMPRAGLYRSLANIFHANKLKIGRPRPKACLREHSPGHLGRLVRLGTCFAGLLVPELYTCSRERRHRKKPSQKKPIVSGIETTILDHGIKCEMPMNKKTSSSSVSGGWSIIRQGTLIGIFISLQALLPSESLAVGFRLPNQDPEGIARGNAFAATADNPSAIYYNPAGITQLEGLQIRAGLYLISADTKYTSPSGEKAETDTTWQAVPQIYAVYSLKEAPFSFGFGVYSPYGLALDWGGKTSFRDAAENGKLLYVTFNPVIAWQVHPTLSLAVGPTINFSQATLENGLSPLNPNDKFK